MFDDSDPLASMTKKVTDLFGDSDDKPKSSAVSSLFGSDSAPSNLFDDSPRSSPSSGTLFGDGASTFRKKDSTFGAGASEDGTSSPVADLFEHLGSSSSPVQPSGDPVEEMQALVKAGKASPEAVALVKRALETHRAKIQECSTAINDYLEATEGVAGDSVTAAAKKALKELKDI